MEDSMFSHDELAAEHEKEMRRLALAQRLFVRRFQGMGEVQQVAALASLLKAIDTPLDGRIVLASIEFALDMTPVYDNRGLETPEALVEDDQAYNRRIDGL